MEWREGWGRGWENGKARIQVRETGHIAEWVREGARGAFPQFRAGATMLAGARNCHFQALKAPLGPSGLLPANNKRWSVLKEATMYLQFNLRISRFSTIKCHLQQTIPMVVVVMMTTMKPHLLFSALSASPSRKGNKKNTRFHST